MKTFCLHDIVATDILCAFRIYLLVIVCYLDILQNVDDDDEDDGDEFRCSHTRMDVSECLWPLCVVCSVWWWW